MNLKAWKQFLSPAKLATAGLLILSSFLVYQHLMLWYQGSAFSSVYAQGHLPKVERMALGKGEVEKTIPCVTVKAIVPKSQNSNAKNLVGSQILPMSLGEIAGHSPEIQPSLEEPDFPLLLSRYIVKAPLFSDLVLESYLDKDGTNRLQPAPPELQPKKHLFEMGRQREIGLWLGYEYSSLQLNAELQPDPNLGLAFDISYKQDLFRVGPVWSGLRVEGGYSQDAGFSAKAQLGIPIFRF